MTLPLVIPPSQKLPPARGILEQPPETLARLVDYLHSIYNPPIRGSRRLDRKGHKPPSVLTNVSDDLAALEVFRVDAYERTYAVGWLNALVYQLSDLPENQPETFEPLIHSATALIAVCAGSISTITRQYAFFDPSLDADVKLSLKDLSIDADADADSVTVGTQTWGSACLMAEMLIEEPAKFGFTEVLSRAEGVRVLELGAGTGLVSLATAKFLSMHNAQATVIASDYHPAVLSNLAYNIAANFTGTEHVALSAHPLDWSRFSGAPKGPREPPFDEPFNLILGADIVYELTHALWVRDTVAALLPRSVSAGAPAPRFHLIIPLRPTHTTESRILEEVFPAAGTGPTNSLPASTLCVLEKESVLCEVDNLHRSEMEYVRYVIGWASP